MEDRSPAFLPRLLGRLSVHVERRAWWVLAAAGLATLFCAAYTYRNLGINTDMMDMLSSDLSFQQTREQYRHAFPQLTDLIVLVIEANTPDMAHAAVKTLAARLRDQKDLIQSVYSPTEGHVFETHALLYHDLAEVEELGWTVAESQRYIVELMQDRSLRGLFTKLNGSYDRTGWVNERLLDCFFLR